MGNFIAIDGEADSQGRYIVLCDSTGRTLRNLDGIPTTQALDWLLELSPRKETLVCFGLNYDVNQWVADLSRGQLEYIVREGSTSYRYKYILRWIPNKFFTVRDLRTNRNVKVCEVLGFYQTSFVRALKAWGLEAPKELEQMKQARGTFTAATLARIEAYCHKECELLVTMMERLREACVEGECLPSRNNWIGAGSLAASLLRNNGVKEHHAYDADLGIEDEALGSYFGGRVELLAQGALPMMHTTDIRSAYPAAAINLPSLTGCKVTRSKRYLPDQPHAMWRVEWTEQNHNGVCPFPVRTTERAISYPRSGSGTYHAVEVAAALKLGYTLRITGGTILRPNDVQPFAFLGDVYALRARYKRRNNPAEKALKLAMNSVYGKLAQGYGFGGQPPFQSFYWAGAITAATRARMLEAAHRVKHPLMISTDGLFSADSPRVRDTTRLGGWECGAMQDALLIQPGVYVAVVDGVQVVKSRGFSARDLDWDEARDTWAQDGPQGVVRYQSRRFIGARSALHRNRLELWRTWPTETRTLSFEAMRKDGYMDEGLMPCRALRPMLGGVESVPYVPKGSPQDTTPDDAEEMNLMEEQPHHEGTN